MNFKDILEFKKLEKGWMEGEGKPFNHNGLDWLYDLFTNNYSDKYPTPYFYPTIEGNILIEWSKNNYEMELCVDINKHFGHWFAIDMITDKTEKTILDLDDKLDFDWLKARLRIEQLKKLNI